MNKIFQSDYKNILSTIEDRSIDLICIDPPYEIGIASWDKDTDWEFLFHECGRILKLTGNLVMFAGWSTLPTIFDFYERYSINKILDKDLNYLQPKNHIAWDRIKGRGAKKNFVSTREEILWFTKGEDYAFNPEDSTIKKKTDGMGKKNGSEYRRLSNVWTDISPIVPWSKEKLDHPTQKPLKLIERIIRVFSNEDDFVLDCFCGSGTVAEACENLNRDYICSDNDPVYIEMTRKRIERLNIGVKIRDKNLSVYKDLEGSKC